MKRFIARVNGVRHGVLELTYWPINWKTVKPAPLDEYANIKPDFTLRKKVFSRSALNLVRLRKLKHVFGMSGRDDSLKGRGYVTAVGAFWCGTCAEIWTWIEVDGDIQRRRVHVRAIGWGSRT